MTGGTTPAASAKPILDASDLSVYVDGLHHPEGVTWGPDCKVWAGGERGEIYRIDDAAKGAVEVGSSGGFTLGVALDSAGDIFACDPIARCVQVFDPDGTCQPYSDGSPDVPIVAPNHLAFASSGDLFVSDSGRWKQNDGRIYRIRPGGQGEIWSDALRTVPNGLCLGPGEAHLYVAMTLNPGRIARVEIRSDGSAGRVEDYALLEGTLPDGLAFAQNGDLYVVTYRPDSVFVIRAETREVELYAADPEGALLASPTNLAFGQISGTPMLFSANIGRWHLTSMPVEVAGLPLNYPVGLR
jgi:gluconolactonase